jgi:hypothetical protein
LAPATGGQPFPLRPTGYSVFLYLLKPFHSLVVVAAVQHLLGLGIAALIYAVCLRLGLPRWLSTLAALPVLFDAWQITTEHMLLSETLFTAVVMAALALSVWWRPSRRAPFWAVGLAGLLVGVSGLLKSSGEFLIIPLALLLLLRRAGLARVALTVGLFAVPLIGYAGWFDSQFGWFGLSPGGLFAYGRVAMFANCGHDALTPAERAICPTTADKQNGISWIIWNAASPYNRLRGGLHYKTSLGQQFAITVVQQQPGDYATTVAKELGTEVSPLRQSSVPDTFQYDVSPQYGQLPAVAEYFAKLYQDGNSGQPHPVRPVATSFRVYQLWVHVPGLAFLIGIGLGGLGVALGRDRSGSGKKSALLGFGLSGVALLVLPVFVATLDYRYLVPALPPLSVAAALGVGLLISARTNTRSTGTAPEPSPTPSDAGSTSVLTS